MEVALTGLEGQQAVGGDRAPDERSSGGEAATAMAPAHLAVDGEADLELRVVEQVAAQ